MTDTLQAEQSVLGAILTEYEVGGGTWLNISTLIESRDFSHPRHAMIFGAMSEIAGAGDEINYSTVAARLGDDLLDLGGFEYLAELGSRVLFYGHSVKYAKQIKTEAKSRRAKQSMADAMLALEKGQPPADVLHNLQLLREMGDGDDEPKDVLADAFEKLSDIQTGKSAGNVNLGFRNLDPFAPSPDELVVIAARPSVGKTALAVSIAENMTSAGKQVLFVSAEMSAGAVVLRRVAAHSGVDQSKLKHRNGLSDHDYKLVSEAFAHCKDKHMHIVDGVRKTPEVANTIRLHVREHGVKHVFVDHLHLMIHPPADRQDLRIGITTKSLAALCKDLGITIFLLAQLNRAVESREDKIPNLSDLRDSGAIEEDADIVLFLQRTMRDGAPGFGSFRIGCAKNRNGPVCTAELEFDPACGRFRDNTGGQR